MDSPIRTESSMSENCEQDFSSPESIPSPVKKQATMSSILYRDSPSPIKPEPVGELERLRFDVYVEALTTVLEEFSEEDVLEYGR